MYTAKTMHHFTKEEIINYWRFWLSISSCILVRKHTMCGGILVETGYGMRWVRRRRRDMWWRRDMKGISGWTLDSCIRLNGVEGERYRWYTCSRVSWNVAHPCFHSEELPHKQFPARKSPTYPPQCRIPFLLAFWLLPHLHRTILQVATLWHLFVQDEVTDIQMLLCPIQESNFLTAILVTLFSHLLTNSLLFYDSHQAINQVNFI